MFKLSNDPLKFYVNLEPIKRFVPSTQNPLGDSGPKNVVPRV